MAKPTLACSLDVLRQNSFRTNRHEAQRNKNRTDDRQNFHHFIHPVADH